MSIKCFCYLGNAGYYSVCLGNSIWTKVIKQNQCFNKKSTNGKMDTETLDQMTFSPIKESFKCFCSVGNAGLLFSLHA
jgi:hypothetical protein